MNTKLGIAGTFKKRNDEEAKQIGFTPITDDSMLGDAIYGLMDKVGNKYSEVERLINSHLQKGRTQGIIFINGHPIQWEVVTEQEHDNS